MSDWNKLLRRVDAFLVTIPGERRARELHEDISAYLNEKPHEPRAEIAQVAGTVIPPSTVTWTDGLGNTGSYEQHGHVIEASTPHAARKSAELRGAFSGCEYPHAAAEPRGALVETKQRNTLTNQGESGGAQMDEAMPFYCADCGSTIPGVHSAQCPETAAAEPEKPRLPDFMRRTIERECDAAEHPEGMSTHDGRARVPSSYLRRLLAIIDAPSAQPIAREPTSEMLEAARRVVPWLTSLLCRKLWYAMYAALKSAGKEST